MDCAFSKASQEEILQNPKGIFPARLIPDNDIGYFFIADFPNCCGCNG